MPILPVVKYGHPVLRKPAENVSEFGDELTALLCDMKDTLKAEDGIGLAANQIGVSSHVLIIDTTSAEDDGKMFTMLNAKITKKNGRKTAEEGCLSIPEIRLQVDRAIRITVEYLDEKGIPTVATFEDLLARVIQHEVDHLNGIFMVDRVGLAQRNQIAKQLEEIRNSDN